MVLKRLAFQIALGYRVAQVDQAFKPADVEAACFTTRQ